MVKLRVTKKEIRENYRIVGIGYCGAQYLLKHQEPFGYSSGVYGWACDYYEVDGVIISSGYDYIHNKNVKCDYEMIKKYDNKASEIDSNYDLPYEERKKAINDLLHEFIKECKSI